MSRRAPTGDNATLIKRAYGHNFIFKEYVFEETDSYAEWPAAFLGKAIKYKRDAKTKAIVATIKFVKVSKFRDALRVKRGVRYTVFVSLFFRVEPYFTTNKPGVRFFFKRTLS